MLKVLLSLDLLFDVLEILVQLVGPFEFKLCENFLLGQSVKPLLNLFKAMLKIVQLDS